ncbi:hypothetical protein BDW22DRAFT_1345618 [Trametopsis cervina]|nr:hypothetical protein BDW22DRAFT_1345618 [Trametopsis cervina]
MPAAIHPPPARLSLPAWRYQRLEALQHLLRQPFPDQDSAYLEGEDVEVQPITGCTLPTTRPLPHAQIWGFHLSRNPTMIRDDRGERKLTREGETLNRKPSPAAIHPPAHPPLPATLAGASVLMIFGSSSRCRRQSTSHRNQPDFEPLEDAPPGHEMGKARGHIHPRPQPKRSYAAVDKCQPTPSSRTDKDKASTSSPSAPKMNDAHGHPRPSPIGRSLGRLANSQGRNWTTPTRLKADNENADTAHPNDSGTTPPLGAPQRTVLEQGHRLKAENGTTVNTAYPGNDAFNCWATLGDLRQRGIEEEVVDEGRGVEDGLTGVEPTLYVFDGVDQTKPNVEVGG